MSSRRWHQGGNYVDERIDFPIIGKQQPITWFFLGLGLVFLALNYLVWYCNRDIIAAAQAKNVKPAPFKFGNSNFFYKKDYKKLLV